MYAYSRYGRVPVELNPMQGELNVVVGEESMYLPLDQARELAERMLQLLAEYEKGTRR
jgi:hypothetical protein